MTSRRTHMLLAVAGLAALAVCVSPARSAFPGTNGKIAFAAERAGENSRAIYSISPDGTEESRLTASADRDGEPAWSPDGSKIAFTRAQPSTGYSDVFVMNGDGSGTPINLTSLPTSYNRDPAWSPSGDAIAYRRLATNGSDIFRMDADGTNPINLTNTSDYEDERDPAWSPNGDKIAYAAASAENPSAGLDVYVMTADGSETHNLTQGNTWMDRQPSWSPDGQKIVFTSDRGGNAEIWVMDADGSNPTPLTNDPAEDSSPVWSPDGSKIVFESTRDGLPAGLYVMSAGGGTAAPLLTEAGGASPDWQPVLDNLARITITKNLVPESEPLRFELWLDSSLVVQAAGDGDSGTRTVAPGTYNVSESSIGLSLFDSSIECTKNGNPFVSSPGSSFLVDVAASDAVVCTITNVRVYSTPTGTDIVVTPVDPTTGSSPVTIWFDNVTGAGDTYLSTSSSGPPPPATFEVAGVYYDLSTTATFDQAEVCFQIVPPNAPAIAHWMGDPPALSTPTTYYKDVAGPAGALVPAGQGNYACARVTSFSPFALLVPENPVADTEAPVIACGTADGVWHGTNVAIACAASDSGSGLANPGDASFSLSTSVPAGVEDADAQTESHQVCDVAGNCAQAGPVGGNKVDRKAPALTLPSDLTVDATSPVGAAATFPATATDGADPSPSVSCTPASGSVFAIGSRTVSCAATDRVGNSTSGSFAVTVLGAREQLARLIEKVVSASGLPPSLKTQMIGKLQSLVASFDPSNLKQKQAVCLALNVFKRAVQALSGRAIPPAQANEWIADAARIRAVLAC